MALGGRAESICLSSGSGHKKDRERTQDMEGERNVGLLMKLEAFNAQLTEECHLATDTILPLLLIYGNFFFLFYFVSLPFPPFMFIYFIFLPTRSVLLMDPRQPVYLCTYHPCPPVAINRTAKPSPKVDSRILRSITLTSLYILSPNG